MKKKTFLTLLLVTSMTLLLAQNENEQRTYKHDLGFNTNFVILGVYGYSPAPFSGMYKKNVSQNKAIRWGIDATIDQESSDGNNNGIDSDTEHSNVSIAVSIGKEFQHPIGKRWMWYSGADILPSYRNFDSERFVSNEKVYSNEDRALSMSIRPFAGIRFNIYERLYLSMEANVSLSYEVFKRKTIQYAAETSTTEQEGTSTKLKFQPFSGLSLFYRF